MESVWFWLFAASYIGGGIMCLLWLTDGGTRHTAVIRWRKFAVVALWPLALVAAVLSSFVDYMFKPPTWPDED